MERHCLGCPCYSIGLDWRLECPSSCPDLSWRLDNPPVEKFEEWIQGSLF